MKKVALIVVAVLGAAVLIGFAFGGLTNVFGARAAADHGVITITNVGGKCVAETKPELMQGKRNKKVDWEIRDSCKLPADVEVEVRFINGTPFWFSNTGKGKVAIDKLIQPFARVGRPYYKYEVWAVGPGTEYKMEDPELEIVQ